VTQYELVNGEYEVVGQRLVTQIAAQPQSSLSSRRTEHKLGVTIYVLENVSQLQVDKSAGSRKAYAPFPDLIADTQIRQTVG